MKKSLLRFMTALTFFYISTPLLLGSAQNKPGARHMYKMDCYNKFRLLEHYIHRDGKQKNDKRAGFATGLAIKGVVGLASIVALPGTTDHISEYRAKNVIKKLAKKNLYSSLKIIKSSLHYPEGHSKKILRDYRNYLSERTGKHISLNRLIRTIITNNNNGMLCGHLRDREFFPYYADNFRLYSELVPDYAALLYRDYVTFGSVEDEAWYSDLKISDFLSVHL